MKRRPLTPNVQNLLTYVQPDLNAPLRPHAQALQPFIERGLATAEQAAALAQIDYKRISELLNALSQSSYNRPAALRSAMVRLEGRRGRSQKLYLLTEAGALVVQALFGCPSVQVPQLTSAVELTAAYAIVEIYTQARNADLPAEVEKPLYFEGGRNVRPDVIVGEKKKTLFELEQAANQGTLPRAVDKLSRLHNFFNSPHAQRVDRRIRMLFNLSQNDTKTLGIWQDALRDVCHEARGKLSFQLYVRPLQSFLSNPSWDDLDGFDLLVPSDEPAVDPRPAPESDHEISELLVRQSSEQIDELRAVTRARERVYVEQLRAVQNQADHALRVQAFFEIMTMIYQSSHYRYSPIDEYAALPIESLDMLRRFLHDPQNAELLSDLKHILEWTFEHNTGVMSLRNGYTAMLWRFLKHYGFGPNGPLTVSVQFPEFGDSRSDIYVEARIGWIKLANPQPSYIGIGNKKPEDVALSWVLEAMLTYPSELGIGQPPWAKSKPARKKKSG